MLDEARIWNVVPPMYLLEALRGFIDGVLGGVLGGVLSGLGRNLQHSDGRGQLARRHVLQVADRTRGLEDHLIVPILPTGYSRGTQGARATGSRRPARPRSNGRRRLRYRSRRTRQSRQTRQGMPRPAPMGCGMPTPECAGCCGACGLGRRPLHACAFGIVPCGMVRAAQRRPVSC